MNGNDPGEDAVYLEAAASRRAQQEMEAKAAPALDRIATALERIADRLEAVTDGGLTTFPGFVRTADVDRM